MPIAKGPIPSAQVYRVFSRDDELVKSAAATLRHRDHVQVGGEGVPPIRRLVCRSPFLLRSTETGGVLWGASIDGGGDGGDDGGRLGHP